MMVDALIQFVAAFFGTIAFSVIFFVPREHYLGCGMIGGLGWLFYWCLTAHLGCPIWAELFSQRFLWCCSPEYAAWRLSAPPRCFCLPVSSLWFPESESTGPFTP